MLQTRHSPIIVGDRYELAEAFGHIGGNDGGLLAKTNYQTALLSMPGYDKHATSEMNDYESRKSSHVYTTLADYSTSHTADGSYYAYVPIDLSDSQVGISSTAFGGTPDQALHDSNSSYQLRAMYGTTDSDLTEYSMRKALVVESFSPTRGNPGTQVNIYLRSDYDLLADPILVFTILFGTYRVSASLTRLETSGPSHEFAASAIAPDMSETSLSNTTLQLQLQIQEQSGQDAGTVEVGYFQYITSVLGSSPQSLEGIKKRKLSESSMSSIQNLDDTSFTSSVGFVSPQTSQVLDSSLTQRRYSPYGRAQNKFRDITSRSGTQDLSIASAARPLMRPPNSSSSAFSPSYSFVQSAGRSSTTDSSSVSSAPLIRTSTLQQSPGSSPAFNPYPLYGQKAVLKLKGNLNSMADNWTPEEWAAKRRLVQFFRSRDGCTVHAHFAPVKPEDRQPNSITISCIWWEERQECFATSVDTIALLEQLVDNRFTVEEKNRIRRNLEGFKPLTVAKGKADSEEFFKVIMGFPNPKPRNIEKDVKVFEWKILGGALKKIMSKYSASHSSTAGPLSGSESSLFTGYQSDPPPEHNRISSRSASISTASSNTYAQTLKSNMPSPNDALPSHYSDAVTGKSLRTLTHNYVSPSLPTTTQFQPFLDQSLQHQQQNQQHQHNSNHSNSTQTLPSTYPTTPNPLERSRSYHDLPDYAHSLPGSSTDNNNTTPPYLKRPRANTSSFTTTTTSTQPHTHQHHTSNQNAHLRQATLAYHHHVSHSFSEQPSSLSSSHHQQHHRSGSISQILPPLNEEYASASASAGGGGGGGGVVATTTSTPDAVFMPQPQSRRSAAALVGGDAGGRWERGLG